MMPTKEQILSEIRRTAAANGGVPLGRQRFQNEAGIGRYDWFGRHWTRWSAAIREAGLEPNSRSQPIEVERAIEQLVQLSRRLGRLPTHGDVRLARRSDSSIPSVSVFQRLGAGPRRAALVIAYCADHPSNEDVADLWKPAGATNDSPDENRDPGPAATVVGYVYLVKHGSRREFKIGRTYNRLRRNGEIGIQLPEKVEPLHYIETDDPEGVEAYWHRQFAAKRKEGEWFALTADDVRAFKRWRHIF